MTIKTISIKQPWADLILSGIKDVENRTWSTDYRGPILIHAGKRIDPAGADAYPDVALRAANSGRTGAVIGSAFLYACTQKQRSKWHEAGYFGWYLTDAVMLPQPIPWPGQLSIFEIDLSKLSPSILLCTRCESNLSVRGGSLCACCQWYLENNTDRFAPEPVRERRAYQEHLTKLLIAKTQG